MHKTKVVIAIPVLLIGGTEIQTFNLAKVLISDGYQITVCCYYEYDESVVDFFKKAGAEVVLLKLRRYDGLIHLLRKLIILFKTIRPDIVHVQYLAPGLVPIIAARIAGIRTVFSTVHIAGEIAYGTKAKFLLRIAARLCTAFFCVSKGVEEFWFGNSQVFNTENSNLHRKHYTIYNAVDTEKISKIIEETDKASLRAALGINNRKVLGIVGRLAYQKGHAVLFEALPEVISKHHDIILIVIGEGPDRMSIELRAKSLKLEDNILWLGTLDQEKVFELYGIMDIFVMPSLYEGFGLTAAEAMAAGLPVVATRVDGLTEVIENDVTGVLVSTGDSATLASALTGLLSDREKAREMGQKGQERVRELFSMEKFQKSILAAYEVFAVRKS